MPSCSSATAASAERELAGHLQEARWTLRNVEQRFSTILDVAAAIVRRQQHFLEFGAMAMKPLGLREIADEVGIHESTVSRVTNNKYMATPIGVFELKYFFSRAMVSANGSACSGTAIRGLIKDIIEAERAGCAAVGRRDHAPAGAAGAGRRPAHGDQVPADAAHRGGRAASCPAAGRGGCASPRSGCARPRQRRVSAGDRAVPLRLRLRFATCGWAMVAGICATGARGHGLRMVAVRHWRTS